MYKSVITLIFSILLLQGCAALAVGTTAGAIAKSANDRRSVGTQIDDTTASGKITYRWANDPSLSEFADIEVNVYSGVALLTGQAPTQELIAQAEQIAEQVDTIHKVHNQIRLGQPVGAATQANDIWLGSKVKAKLLADDTVPGIQVKVIVENGEVFLMGRLTNKEATTAVEIARNVTGIKRVVRALELL